MRDIEQFIAKAGELIEEENWAELVILTRDELQGSAESDPDYKLIHDTMVHLIDIKQDDFAARLANYLNISDRTLWLQGIAVHAAVNDRHGVAIRASRRVLATKTPATINTVLLRELAFNKHRAIGALVIVAKGRSFNDSPPTMRQRARAAASLPVEDTKSFNSKQFRTNFFSSEELIGAIKSDSWLNNYAAAVNGDTPKQRLAK